LTARKGKRVLQTKGYNDIEDGPPSEKNKAKSDERGSGAEKRT